MTHVVYDSVPIPPPRDGDFAILGRSGYYLVALLVSCLVGGLIAHFQRKNFLRIASSVIGGGCVTCTVHCVRPYRRVHSVRGGTDRPLFACTIIGTMVQSWRARRRRVGRAAEVSHHV